MPLLLSHGWPSTFLEFSKIIPLLTDPASFGGKAEDAFEVIVPSLPGFGFSDRPTERGMSTTKMAALFNRLMTEELGFKKFAAQGGDFGNIITEALALGFPDALTGIYMDHIPYKYVIRPIGKSFPGCAGIYAKNSTMVVDGGRLLRNSVEQTPNARLRPQQLPNRTGRVAD